MSAMSEKVLNFVTNAGNSTTYREIHAAVEFEERRLLPNAMKELKQKGAIVEEVALVDGKIVHTVKKV